MNFCEVIFGCGIPNRYEDPEGLYADLREEACLSLQRYPSQVGWHRKATQGN